MKTIRMIEEIPEGEIESLYLETEFSAFSALPLREWGNVLILNADKAKNSLKIDFDIAGENRKDVEFLILRFLRLNVYRVIVKVSNQVFCFSK